MREKIRKLTDMALTAGFLGFIYLVLVMTYTGPVQKAVEDTTFTFASYENLSEKLEEILQKNIYKKYGFINLNGRIMRILRINSLNDINKMANGFLTWIGGVKDESEYTKLVENVIELNKFLSDRGTPFIYILAPSKNSMYDAKFAPGYVKKSYTNIGDRVNALENGGVTTINMQTWFKANGWNMENVFFKTDHHWTPKAGLAAARCTMELLQQQGIAEYDEEKLQDKSYKIRVLRNWFLGSQGRRVGKYYTGTDDISIYQPKFKTKYSYAGLQSKTTDWFFYNNILNMDYTKEKDYFEKNPYFIYLYGDYPLRVTINTNAKNDKKLLITGCSYKVIPEYFLTTQFKEVYTIDTSINTNRVSLAWFSVFFKRLVNKCASLFSLVK